MTMSTHSPEHVAGIIYLQINLSNALQRITFSSVCTANRGHRFIVVYIYFICTLGEDLQKSGLAMTAANAAWFAPAMMLFILTVAVPTETLVTFSPYQRGLNWRNVPLNYERVLYLDGDGHSTHSDTDAFLRRLTRETNDNEMTETNNTEMTETNENGILDRLLNDVVNVDLGIQSAPQVSEVTGVGVGHKRIGFLHGDSRGISNGGHGLLYKLFHKGTRR